MTITIGGSEIAAVLNEGYGCSRALFYRKTGIESENPLTDDNPHIKRGKDMEPIIVKKFEKDTGYFVELPEHLGYIEGEVRGVPLKGSLSWQKGHADGIVYDKEMCGTALGILECKAPADRSFKAIKAEGLPIDYILQLQYYMALAEVDKGYFAIHGCGENWEFIYFPVEADKELQDIIMNACQRFIDDVSVDRMPEQLQEDDKRCRRCEYRQHCRNLEIDYSDDMINFDSNEELIEAVMEYEKAKEIEAEAKEIKEDNAAKIKEIMGEHSKGFFDNVRLTKYDSTKNNIDAEALRRDMPEIAKLYTKSGKQSTTLKITRRKNNG